MQKGKGIVGGKWELKVLANLADAGLHILGNIIFKKYIELLDPLSWCKMYSTHLFLFISKKFPWG